VPIGSTAPAAELPGDYFKLMEETVHDASGTASFLPALTKLGELGEDRLDVSHRTVLM
jgi:hypothetical protein